MIMIIVCQLLYNLNLLINITLLLQPKPNNISINSPHCQISVQVGSGLFIVIQFSSPEGPFLETSCLLCSIVVMDE